MSAITRRGATAAALVLATTAACTVQPATQARPSNARSLPGDVLLSGRFVHGDGRGLAGRTVLATREATGSDLVGDFFATAFTGGLVTLSCVTGEEPALETCRTEGFTAGTSTTGRWAMRLRRDDVRSVGGSLRKLTISAGAAKLPGQVSGPAIAVAVDPNGPRITLPQLRLWEPSVTATGTAKVLRFRYGAPPVTDASVALALSQRSRGLRLADDDASRPEVLDARLVEDATVDVALSARSDVDGHEVTWFAPVTTTKGTAGAPPSRGASCTVTVGSVAGAPGPCWLDDGQFGSSYPSPRPQSCKRDQGPVGSETSCLVAPVGVVTVDLGTSIPVALVVLRASAVDDLSAASSDLGPNPDVAVSASADGSTWRAMGTVGGDQLVSSGVPVQLVPPDVGAVRYVRLEAADPPSAQPRFVAADLAGARRNSLPHDPAAIAAAYRGDLAGLAELSVWPGHPPARPRSAPLRLGAPPLSGTGPGGGNRLRWELLALLALLVAAAGLAVGTRVCRRP